MSKKIEAKVDAKAEAQIVRKAMSKILTDKTPVTFRDRPCYLKPLTYQEDLVMSAIVQDVSIDAIAAGVPEKVLSRAASIAAVLGLIKFALYDAETNALVFPTMESINESTKESVKEYLDIQNLYDVYMGTLELTQSEKKS